MVTIFGHALIFGACIVVAWFIFVYFWPRVMLYVYKRGLLVKGFGEGPVPINTMYTQSESVFADPLRASLPPGSSKLMSYGTNRDTLYTVGWLDLSKGPQVLHVPNMAGRYYSVQFTDPSNNTNFAYIGKRTTGTKAGDYLITGPKWKGTTPHDMEHVPSPKGSVIVIGRVFVKDSSDLPTAHRLATQIRLAPQEAAE